MKLPIYGYGQEVLRKVGKNITPEYPQLSQLIADMWETMYNAKGIGLAAPQIGRDIRLFLVDTAQLETEDRPNNEPGIKQVFINAKIVEEAGKEWAYEEGCLSIPHIRGNVKRLPQIKIEYMDEQFQKHERIFDGLTARVIQHEYDHIEGKLFVDLLQPLKKMTIKKQLERIKKGKIEVNYRMIFAE